MFEILEHLPYIVSEPEHEKDNKMAYAPSKDSDQHVHPPSLISLPCLPEGLGLELSNKVHSKDSDETVCMRRLISAS